MTDEPFGEDDRAYVEVIASLFAARFEEQQQNDRIAFQIEHDELTGLAGSDQFRTAVRLAISAHAPFAIASINLDSFRNVNDRYGNDAGDAVLVEVAARLRRVAGGDLVARVGSDEFAIMMSEDLTPELAAARLQRYTDLFRTPFLAGSEAGGHALALGASIGAARFPADGDSAEAVYRRCGFALDAAKAHGGSVTCLFENPMEPALTTVRLRVVELRDAIANDQLAIVYQPTFSLATRWISGAEALVRWNRPGREPIGPAQFVDFAERNGLIAALTRWVFARVSSDVARTSALPDGFRIYINLAAPMLEDHAFIAAVNTALGEQPALAEHLGFEVTESAAMENVERSIDTLARFRGWGLHVAIDDFGTGHSSLAYLNDLTVDLVKIDRSFVAGLPQGEGDGQVVEMLLQVIARFGFAALAEGIETEAQAAWLLEHGCRFGQGFLVAKPRSFDELLQRIGVRHERAPSEMAV
jgi:diguanylate cyclase (GGDEF)-like protein